MKRFLLILVSLVTSSCELPSIIQADQYIEPIPLEVSEVILVYENVWDRIKDASTSEQTNLDEKHSNILMLISLIQLNSINSLKKVGTLYFLFLRS